jgi:hypothetical protein
VLTTFCTIWRPESSASREMTHFIAGLLRRFGGKVQWFIIRLITVSNLAF